MSNGDPVVETNDLTKVFGEFTALDRLTISLNRGQILGFIGPNGAGKTTAIKILVGLMRPTSGSARIAGADCVRDARRIKRLVGYMPDRFGSYDNMRVREYLDFFGAVFGIARRERAKRINEVLETTGSTYMQDRFVESLSHGMQQRIGVARTLLHQPEVLILDEPANGLDPDARIEMRELLVRLAASGKTLIVTSHILPELSRICNIVAIITRGKLRVFGPLEQIMRTIRQRRICEVQLVDSSELEQARTTLVEALDETERPTITVIESESLLRFQSSRDDRDLAALLAHLVDRRVAIAQFREVPTDLEDAFLSVTREEKQEAEVVAK
ncbi:MAG: ABC transporter ATP-binding protein [Planctomycetes bacterium]|nr:ABC transporter ATP-binding protein [Planctomycetota bacterium]